ncbi:GRAM domain-containing protein [Sporobolomyces salmoneus]|uniref:GRAM domain-containing protein n=1 Tax=Sporobolomyces salmoneus TaxID=183962 RepID=UPI0031805723
MASLNWVVLDSNTLKPVPLPREKVLLSLSSVSLHLLPFRPQSSSSSSTSSSKPVEYKVEKGTVHLSNQRVVYVSPPQLHSTSTSSSTPALETLSCPYTHFQDGRLNQPFFGANYFEALLLPAAEGGLSDPHVIRLYFKEGGGFDFYSTVLEMKERLASLPRSSRSRGASSNNVVGEDLPLYSASTAPTSGSQSTSSTPPAARTMPSTSDLQAASIAQQAELEEDDQRTRPTEGNRLPPPPTSPLPTTSLPTGAAPPIGDDAPPSYTA